jgi:hypothetical protein
MLTCASPASFRRVEYELVTNHHHRTCRHHRVLAVGLLATRRQERRDVVLNSARRVFVCLRGVVRSRRYGREVPASLALLTLRRHASRVRFQGHTRVNRHLNFSRLGCLHAGCDAISLSPEGPGAFFGNTASLSTLISTGTGEFSANNGRNPDGAVGYAPGPTH